MPYYIAQTGNHNSLKEFSERVDAKQALVIMGLLDDVTDYITNPDYPQYQGWNIYDDSDIQRWLEAHWLGGPKFFSVGDYGGAGAVGKANIDWATDNLFPEDYFLWEGGYSSQVLYLKPSDETQDIVDRLEDYPVISDDHLNQVNREWEDADWESWIKDELIHKMKPEFVEKVEEVFGDKYDQMLRWAYEDAKEASGQEWTSENNGGYICTAKIYASFLIALEGYLEKEKLDA
jgi:hypothetical protein